MAEFKTRIQLKYDTYTNWSANNPVLLKGEIAIAEIPDETGQVANEPAYLMKVGDGTSNFNSLSWISGIAADVYSWAKAATKPVYNASEIQNLDSFISGQIEDTDTQYQIVKNGNMGFKLQSKPKTGGEWTDVNSITLVPPTYSLKEGAENGTVKFGIAGSEQSVKVHGLGSAAYTESSEYDAAGTAQGLINGLNAEGATAGSGEVISSVTQENGVITVNKKTLTKNDIPTLNTSKISGLDATLEGKQDNLVFNTPYNSSTNKVATMEDVTTAVEGLSGAMHYRGVSTTNPAQGSVSIADKPQYSPAAGDVVTYQKKEFIYDGSSWRELGDESSFAVKGSIKNSDIASDANIAQSKIANLTEDLASKATPAQITSAINALDKADSAVSNQFVTAVKQENGVITVSRAQPTVANINGLNAALNLKADDADLKTVAKTGLIEDLTQGAGYITFNCGSSTEVM